MTAASLLSNAELALAAYAILQPGLTRNRTDALQMDGNGLSRAQADSFALRYPEIIVQLDDVVSGFSMTAFRDASGAIALAIRGSEPSLNDWLPTNVNIAINGAGYQQIAALYNAWQRLTHTLGETITIYRVDLSDSTNPVIAETVVNDLGSAEAPLISPGAAVDVAGHSLGGHLALAFAGLFPINARQVHAFNAPGFIDSTLNRNFFARLGGALPVGTAPGGVPTVNVIADAQPGAGESFSPIAGLHSRPGTPLSIAIENQAPPTDEPNPALNTFNHSQMILTDSLAVFALLARLAPAFSAASFDLLLGSAALGTAGSLERIVDALGRTFGMATTALPTGNGEREALYQAIYAVQANASYRELEGSASLRVLAETDAATLASEAVADFGKFFALAHLLPFAIEGASSTIISAHADLYARWSADRTKRIAGATDVEFSDYYLEDRAAFLAAKNAANIIDASSIVLPSQADNWRYVDLAQNYEVTAFGAAPAAIRRFAIFGGDGADKLEGGPQEDHFYGGTGTDQLIGRGGNDYQEGGAGLDLYQYSAAQPFLSSPTNDGNDTIRDTDGLGVLRYRFTQGGLLSDTVQSSVIADTSVRLSDTTWQSADGKFKYEKQGSGLVVTIDGDAGGSLTLRDFRDGDFGIHLWSPRSEPLTGRTLEGDHRPEDADPSQAGEQLAYDSWGNVLTTSEVAQDRDDGLFGRDDGEGDLILAGGGNDILFGDTPMMPVPGPRTGFDPLQSGGKDWLQGDAGRDIIDAGPGDDMVEGGFGGVAGGQAGGDVIQGGLGNDTLYGDYRTEIGAAIRNGETDAASVLKGDFVSGGAGEDWLIGSTGDDALMGGGGKDVLIGGAGDDTIRGDDGQGATTLAWTVNNTSFDQNGQAVYLSTVSGTNFFDFSEGGADAIYGGAGADWVFAEVGDDFVDGGSGNDVLFGGFGSDIVLGAAGNDVLVGDEGVDNAAEGGDYLDGGDGNDTIFGNAGDDIIVGGRGDDTLVGGAGKDVYVYEKGDGRDRIDDSDTAGSAASVLHIGPGLAREDVRFGVESLKVYFGSGEEVHFEGFDQLNPSNTPLISELRFDDGQVMTYADILAQGFDIDGTSAADFLTGTGVADRIRGFEGNDFIIGLDGDDFLYGGSGSDTLQGGTGNDTLEGGDGFDALNGGAGDDTYVYDTFDTITDSQGLNRVVFGAGIAPENLSVGSVVVSGQPRLLIARSGAVGAGLEIRGASLTSSNFVYAFADGRTLSQLELLQVAYSAPQSITGTAGNDTLAGFAGNDNISGVGGNDTISGGGGNDSLNGGDNDDTLLGDAGNDQLNGNAGNDTLSGGAGADSLSGGDGADTYLFGYGAGSDTVNDFGNDGGVDTIRLADGIAFSDVTLTHQPNDELTITLNATQERLTLPGWYAIGPFGPSRVEQIAFGDGTVIGEAELAALSIAPISGTAGGDVLTGTAFADTLQGFGGDDVLDGGPNMIADVQTNDLLLGGIGHDTYVLQWRNDRDTVIEEAGETSTIRLAPGMTFDDVAARREGDDLFVHGRRTEHGLLLKNYYTQAHAWQIETALGSSMSIPDFVARPTPTTGDPVRDLWEARKSEFKHDWYAFAPLQGFFTPAQIQADGTIYRAPDSAVNLSFLRTYDNGDWTIGSGGLPAVAVGTGEITTTFGAANVISSDAASQFWRLENTTGTTIRTDAAFDIAWNAPSVSRTTQFLGTFVGFDLLIHSLYRTTASASLSGSVQGVTLNATNGASGPDIVNAVLSGGAVPGLVDGFFDSSTATFNPIEIRGGASSNAIALWSFGMVNGGAGNDVIDAVSGGEFHTAAGGNFLYGGAGNDGITGSSEGDLISGGAGNDTLAGWAGDDTFYFFAEDVGVDIVNEATPYLWDWFDGLTGKALFAVDTGRFSDDTIEFGPGINLADLTLSWGTHTSRYWTTPSLLKTYDTLDIFWGADRGVRVMMPDRFDTDVRKDMTIHSPGESWGIEHFKFADGMTLSLEEMVARIPTQVLNGTANDDFLEGSAGNNEFFGGSGFDDLYGAFGLDIYHFNLGDGEDFIRDPGGNDKVVFGAGITPDMLSLGMGSMLVHVGNGGDTLHIEYFDPNDPFRTGTIETYEFADGTTLTHAQLLERGFDFLGNDFAQTLTGTSVSDRIYGFGGNDTLNGGAGADVLDGGSGNDTLNGGSDADTMRGGAGDDTYVVDSAADVIVENPGEGTDHVQSSISYTLADNFENLTLTGFGSINGTGNALNNIITGNGSSNVLAGLEGNDTLSGASANDTLDGGAGADTMNGGDGNDTYIVDDAGDVVGDSSGTDLVLSSISYTLPVSIENLTLTGTADINGFGHSSVSNVIVGNSGANRLEAGLFRSDSLFGMAGNDTLIGGDRGDLLDGGLGVDTMEGGGGNDTYVVDDLGDVVIDTSGTDLVQASITYTLADNLENLTLIGTAQIGGTGNALNNVISGNSGANVLSALDGNDTLNGGGGADTLLGGAGNDTYVVNNSEVVIVENPGEGTDLVQASVGYTLTDNVENLTLTGTGSVDGTGNALNNVITGNSGANSLFGRDGNDTLNGGAEADVMVGGRGDDTYIVDNLFDAVVEQAGEGTDLVQSSMTYTLGANVENLTLTGGAAINGTGNALANWITGNNNVNVLSGLGGDDTLIGGNANGTLDGGAGADLLDGGVGADSMSGCIGDDTYVVDSAGDVVSEAANAGSDTVRSSLTYTLGGNLENLTLIGTGNTNGTGNALGNVIIGNGGNNVLDGSTGDDVLMGSEGSDSYRFNLGTGSETVEETDTQGDDTDSLLLGSGITTANLLGARSGQDLVLTVSGASERLTLKNWYTAAGNRIERAQFADGTVWDAATLEALAGTSSNPPVVAVPIADQAASEDAQFLFTVPATTFSDPDAGDTLAYTAARGDGSALPGWLAFNPETRTFSGTPAQADVGATDVRVTATDSQGLSAEDLFTLNVANTNDAPTLANAIADQGATEDALFSFTVAANTFADDDQGDTLTWSASDPNGDALPAWLTFDAFTRALSGTPSNDDVGLFSVRVTATDGSNASASDIFGIRVANTNDAPTLQQPIADQSATEDQPFELVVPSGTFADVDTGDALTLSASLADGSPLPAWLSLNGSILSGTPGNADVGGYKMKFTAIDTAGATATDVFRLDIANVNDAPAVATPIADQSFEAGTPFIFGVPAGSFSDEDAGDTLTYSAGLFDGGTLPSWLTFDPANATFSGSPQVSNIGISHIAVTATDMSGASAVSDFALIVRAIANSTMTSGAGDDILYGGTGDETLVAKGGNDALFGDVGDDVLRGGTGNDVLQGEGGSDLLRGGTGQNVLDGGSGDDLVFDGAGDSFISGGAGNDTIRLASGDDVIVFNRGDGWDTIYGGGDGGNTLSFGGGIAYSDLSLSKDGDDLIVNASENDRVVLKDWYGGTHSLLNLQLILDASDEFDAGSSDPLYNRRVQTFSFLGLVNAFDQARVASPGLTSWDITNALLQWHLWGADDAALGGDLAYWYGRNRTLAGISLQAAQQVIGAPGFGSDAQALRPFSGLQEGFVKLA